MNRKEDNMDRLVTLERTLNITFLEESIKFLPINSYATIIATVILIITLCFLLRQNKKLSEQNKELSKQTDYIKNSIIGNTIFEISNNHREITKLAIDDVYCGLCLHPDLSHEDLKAKYILTMAMNHAECVWGQKVLGNITDEYWDGIKVSIIEMFKRDNIKKEWGKIKDHADTGFRNFIEDQMAKSEKIEKQPV